VWGSVSIGTCILNLATEWK